MAPAEVMPPTRAQLYVRGGMFAGMYLFLISVFFSAVLNSLALAGMAACFVVLMILARRPIARPTPLDWWFLAYLAAEGLAVVFSAQPLEALAHSSRVLLIGAVYWFSTWITTDLRAGRAIATLAAAASGFAVFGLWTTTFGGSPGRERLSGMTSMAVMLTGLAVLPFALHPSTPRRIRGTSLGVVLLLLVVLLPNAPGSAAIAFAAGAILVLLVAHRWAALAAAAVLMAVMVIWLPPGLKDYLARPEFLRLEAGAGTLEFWGKGSGPVWTTLLSFAAATALFLQILRTEWRIYRQGRRHWLRGSVALGALAVFAGSVTAGLFEPILRFQEPAVLFWVSLGLTLAVGSMPAPGREA